MGPWFRRAGGSGASIGVATFHVSGDVSAQEGEGLRARLLEQLHGLVRARSLPLAPRRLGATLDPTSEAFSDEAALVARREACHVLLAARVRREPREGGLLLTASIHACASAKRRPWIFAGVPPEEPFDELSVTLLGLPERPAENLAELAAMLCATHLTYDGHAVLAAELAGSAAVSAPEAGLFVALAELERDRLSAGREALRALRRQRRDLWEVDALTMVVELLYGDGDEARKARERLVARGRSERSLESMRVLVGLVAARRSARATRDMQRGIVALHTELSARSVFETIKATASRLQPALEAEARGDHGQAIELAARELEANPDDAPAILLMARSLAASGDAASAADLLRRNAEHLPRDAGGQAARVFFLAGDREAAFAQAERQFIQGPPERGVSSWRLRLENELPALRADPEFLAFCERAERRVERGPRWRRAWFTAQPPEAETPRAPPPEGAPALSSPASLATGDEERQLVLDEFRLVGPATYFRVRVRAHGFAAETDLVADGFSVAVYDLRALLDAPGTVKLGASEEQDELVFSVNHRGDVRVRGELSRGRGAFQRLEFELTTDRAALAHLVEGLEAALRSVTA